MKKLLNVLLAICLCLSLSITAEAKDASLSVMPNHVSADYYFSAVITDDGSLWVWGDKNFAPTTPTKIMGNARQVTCDTNRIAVVTNDNVLWYISMKTGSAGPIIGTPERVRDDVLSYSTYFDSYITTDHVLRRFDGESEWIIATDVISATGLAHGFEGSGYAIVRSDGSLWISGINYYGDGLEQHEENKSATQFTKVMDDVLSVAGDRYTIAVIKKDHSLWMWGKNWGGELGNGTTDQSLTPIKVLDNVIAVDWASHYSSWGALRTDGTLWMWGDNSCHQIGNGEGGYKDGKAVVQLTPTKVLDEVVEFSCGRLYTLAIRTDGSLFGWGSKHVLGENVSESIIGGYQTVPTKLFDDSVLPRCSNDNSIGALPSTWATDEVNAAIAAGLVPENLQKNYQLPVSRGDVARMFINLIEKSSGKDIAAIMDENGVQPNISAFTDTNDKAVLEANALGIINGVGNSKFDPDGTFTRAQIAAIINRIARVLGVETNGYSHCFTDVSGHWVDTELGWPSSVGIINGVGNNMFDPNGDLTTEQAIVITYRALQVLKN